ncbi:MAG: 50S ribosomal protein L10 [Fibrobacteria bacterium]|nr:50S ribosomal protein L10 [Fibrobacteria bacterium]
MISLDKKKQTTDTLDAALAQFGAVFLVDFGRIKVQSDVELRKALRKQGIFYRVAKNTLLKRALHKAGVTNLDGLLENPTAILVGSVEDPVAPARAIVEFQKANAGLLESKASWIDGDVFPGKQIGDVAKMPGKRELQAQVIQLFLSPGATLVGLIKGPGSQVASQIESLVKRLEEAA